MEPTDPSPTGRSARLYNRGQAALSDEDKVLQLQLEASLGELNGAAWRKIRDDVWVYCTKVLTSMICTGTVWGHYRELGGLSATDLRHPSRGIEREVAHDLASDTVAGALPILQNQLITGQWRPDQGAAIRTWATGLAILRLPGVWRKWRRNVPAEAATFLLDDRPSAETAPEAIIYTLEFERYVELLDRKLRPLVRLDCDGSTDAEIAAAAELTIKQVEYRLRKARSTLRHQAELERSREHRRDAG